ncbi:hypothetical protein ARMGADRAFT_1089626 [Armillaria gallica]|uniref:Uncharacterized protein n=1 Tax=Armillaria gallica TaxID=47427 RepID=A0A2H3D413_ARMGA|nr:hypothetical protein ARMGADRAFT_1089626 [Armillaria gallica]
MSVDRLGNAPGMVVFFVTGTVSSFIYEDLDLLPWRGPESDQDKAQIVVWERDGDYLIGCSKKELKTENED